MEKLITKIYDNITFKDKKQLWTNSLNASSIYKLYNQASYYMLICFKHFIKKPYGMGKQQLAAVKRGQEREKVILSKLGLVKIIGVIEIITTKIKEWTKVL